MNKPTTAQIINFLRKEVAAMELVECDETYLVMAAADRIEELEKQRTELTPYINHKGGCDWYLSESFPCTCGLDYIPNKEKGASGICANEYYLQQRIEELETQLKTDDESAKHDIEHLYASLNCEVNRVAELEAQLADIAEDAKGLWIGVHMDGVNEHGSHLLPLLHTSIDLNNSYLWDDLLSMGEDVYADARVLGFMTGSAIIIKVSELDVGYEYTGFSKSLTESIYGSAQQQANELLAVLNKEKES